MRALGLDVGGTNIKVVVLEGDEIVESYQSATAGGLEQAFHEIRANAPRCDAIGVGLAGLVRWPEGVFVWGSHLSAAGSPLRRLLSTELGLPVVVDNDANMSALAELRLGGARGVGSALILMLGTGIGAGVVAGGAVYRGRSFAGEIGHVRAPGGLSACDCGRSGCWETLVSGSVLDAAARRLAAEDPLGMVAMEAGDTPPAAIHLVVAAEHGDVAAQETLASTGGQLGRLIADQIAVLDPEVVVVGGALSGAGPWFFDSVARSVSTNLVGAAYRDPVDIRLSPFGSYSGAVGAAVAAAGAANE